MKRLLPLFLLFPLMAQAQWESIGTDILPPFHRVWSVVMAPAPDYSIWVLSTYDAFPIPAGEVPVVHRLRDGDTTWKSTPITEAGENIGADIAAVDSVTAYAAAFGGGLYQTTNGGSSWQQVESYAFLPIFVHFFDEDNAWIGGRDTVAIGGLVSSTTTDGGETWTHASYGTIGEPIGTSLPPIDSTEDTSISFSVNSSYDVVGDTIVLGRSKGTYWISTDRGKNWERKTTPLSDMGLISANITLKNSQVIMVASGTETGTFNEVPGVSFITQDGGETWTQGAPGLTLAASHYIPNSSGVFISSGHSNFGLGGQGTAITYDFGETWETIDDTRIISMDFVDHEHGVATCCNIWADTQGQVYKWNLEVPTSTIEKSFSENLELWPNPTTGQFNFNLPDNIKVAEIDLEIMSHDGRTLRKSSLPYSEKIEMDISGFTTGIYFLKIWTGDEFISKKIIKTK